MLDKLKSKVSNIKKEHKKKKNTEEKCTPYFLKSMNQLSGLPVNEIETLYKDYFSTSETEEINKQDFIKAYSQLVSPDCRHKATDFAALAFKVFDKDGNGTISFEEFLMSYAIHSDTATQEEKLSFTFDLYDLNGDGTLSKDEIAEASSAIMSLLGMHVHVDPEFLMKLDVDGDECVTKEEFINTLMKNEFLNRVMVPFMQ